ncbi:L-lysine exporter family protein [Janibacter sp. HTCC2649]|uniref:LysE/ArgO family amino acid transporter n=1 Tax=Janibacter sp. HTCC2649 TaxID=313589 RepID=UPI0000671A77|nr:LysE/ArgO family amino acid transporter [Janibacter sp. HTCC2649]EAP97938.1 L-lysine exporter family protein [Janibacter sp. HTCC2649]
MNTTILAAVVAGLFSGFSLIVAIGAQNAFVLRQGVSRQHIGLVVAICAISDLALIGAGVVGVGALVQGHPTILRIVTVGGAAYLVWFGVRSLLAARHPKTLVAGAPSAKTSAVATAFALTWLNPHVYLDTVLMLGNLSTSYGPTGRWWFGAGAGAASILWFTTLGYAARLASRWFAHQRTWRVLDTVIGLVMFALAAMLLRTSF